MIRDNGPFRAWGNFDDVFKGMLGARWSLVGCISTEERCAGLIQNIGKYGSVRKELIFEVEHGPFSDEERINKKLIEYRQKFLDSGTDQANIFRVPAHALFYEYEEKLRQFFSGNNEDNLIIDITSMPQKVLFFITRLITELGHQFQNIVFTYTEPERYDEKALVSNHEPWDVLPGFRLKRGSSQDRKVVIAIGYDPMGLPDQVNSSDFNESSVSFLFPFPSHPDRVSRNWRFIRRIFPNAEKQKLDIKRVDGMNVPEIYEELCGLGGSGTIPLSFAPYGPKPVSLAMALYASRYCVHPRETAVFYTQPLDKNPDYSIGIRNFKGVPVINSYCVKINGEDLY